MATQKQMRLQGKDLETIYKTDFNSSWKSRSTFITVLNRQDGRAEEPD